MILARPHSAGHGHQGLQCRLCLSTANAEKTASSLTGCASLRRRDSPAQPGSPALASERRSPAVHPHSLRKSSDRSPFKRRRLSLDPEQLGDGLSVDDSSQTDDDEGVDSQAGIAAEPAASPLQEQEPERTSAPPSPGPHKGEGPCTWGQYPDVICQASIRTLEILDDLLLQSVLDQAPNCMSQVSVRFAASGCIGGDVRLGS